MRSPERTYRIVDLHSETIVPYEDANRVAFQFLSRHRNKNLYIQVVGTNGRVTEFRPDPDIGPSVLVKDLISTMNGLCQ